MYVILIIVALVVMAIPVTGAVQSFRAEHDRSLGWVFVGMGIIFLVVFNAIWGQIKESEAFANKCEQSHGIVVRGQCIDSRAVIPIQR